MFRNYRRCHCMNNSYANNNNHENENDMLETACNNVVSYEEDMDSCDCGFDEETSIFPENPMLAQSYVPIQYMNKTFKPNIGLKMGTIFPELVNTYLPGQSMAEIAYLRRTNRRECNR